MMEETIYELVIHELQNWWIDFERDAVRKCIPDDLKAMEDDYSQMSSKRYYIENQGMVFDPTFSVTWNI